MDNNQINILLVEDNPSDARILQERLKEIRSGIQFGLTHVESLRAALEELGNSHYDIILLDLGLPDSLGLEGLPPLKQKKSSVPIVVLTGNYEDEKLAVEAVKEGAQDYLFKDQLDSNLLSRSIQYAIERKKSEKALIEARERAEMADRLKSVFLGNMSHEVRTPLTAIIGYTDLMLTQIDYGIDAVKQRKYLDTIKRNSYRLKDLIDDILDISHIEADTTILNILPHSPDDLVKKAVQDIFVTAKAKELTIRENYSAPDIQISIDKLRFQQAILNILQNAVKYTDAGEITIQTSLNKDEYSVSVSDTGIGIKEEFKPYLFAQFRQGDEGPSRKYEGAGLGLSIANRLVTLMKGRIEVESEAGKGSTFTLYFNVTEHKEDKSAAKIEKYQMERPESDLVFDQNKLQTRNLLILQDHPDNLSYIEQGVTALGLQPLTAGTSEEAFALLKDQSVCCMMIDVALKRGMTGIDFMKTVRANNQYDNVPLIVVTAYAMQGQKEELLKQGFNYYLAKPFVIEELKEVLAQALGH
ncbi:MAG: response regulator [Candidatus Neomarinimicrobiota bacterium]